MALIPVVLFAYARPAHLARVLACLQENQVPQLHVYSDGAKGRTDAAAVAEVRALVRAIDWCECRVVERPANLGLGRSVLAGVSEIAREHDAFLVWEDDLICVPGTYRWMCAALERYAHEPRVMSVSAWTHPRVTPPDAGHQPYCDGRADCWVWGAWARSWRGMAEATAVQKMRAAEDRGTPANAYGEDLPAMARAESRKNIWAVRWLYHHLEHGGLCVRPPWSLVEHIGFDAAATNAAAATDWANPPLRAAPPVPEPWPVPAEHPACRALWQTAAVGPDTRMGARLRRLARRVVPRALLEPVRQRFFRVRWVGDYPDWAAARVACGGYATKEILAKISAAARAVRDGRASYERDGVTFQGVPPWWPGSEVLREAMYMRGGKLSVLDFGGAFGTLYRQARSQMGPTGGMRWRVVEQPEVVAMGRREFQRDELEFFSSIREACAAGMPDVIVLASVLSYLPDPEATLAELLAVGASWVFVERTGFTTEGGRRLTVQHVPRSIYRASYPCCFLDRTEFLRQVSTRYRVVVDRRDEIDAPPGLEFRSVQLARLSE
jgi:putative methyltransferase (TIGR04325 family)